MHIGCSNKVECILLVGNHELTFKELNVSFQLAPFFDQVYVKEQLYCTCHNSGFFLPEYTEHVNLANHIVLVSTCTS